MNLAAYLPVLEDLSQSLPSQQRFQRLLMQIQQVIPSDAIALLALQQNKLLPIAAIGLSPQVYGREFVLDEHPRLSNIVASQRYIRFEHDSPLPDPYEGLVEHEAQQLDIHDCMGVALTIDNDIWGVLTLDSLTIGTFEAIGDSVLQHTLAITQAVIKAAIHLDKLEQRIAYDHQISSALNQSATEQTLIGNSHAMQTLLSDISAVAPTELNVLITGETGVGKELVAKRVHQQSQRSDQPLVHINCAALPEATAESELFGHTKGAFTGAQTQRLGRIQLADGGTLFLDEIGELPLALQAKLLRTLQQGEIQRMGSDTLHHVDVRVIAATNRDLSVEVAEGRFRSDLFHRLNVYPIAVPPLRERDNDVLLLANYVLEQNQRRLNVRKLLLDAECIPLLLQTPWYGNVRELEHSLSRAALKAIRDKQANSHIAHIKPHHIGIDVAQHEPRRHEPPAFETNTEQEALTLKQATDQFQRQFISQTLEQTKNNFARAARLLGVDRSNFSRLSKRLGLDHHK